MEMGEGEERRGWGRGLGLGRKLNIAGDQQKTDIARKLDLIQV